MKITSPKGELFHLSFHRFDVILYSKFPYKFRKVVYPGGSVQMAAGAFSWNRTPSERRHSHGHHLLWEEELKRRRTAEGADGLVVGSGPVPAAPVPGSECQVPDVPTKGII